MKLAPHGPKSSETRRALGTTWHGSLLVVGTLVTASAGCNIVQGYQDAGDSLFPEQSTYLASPGLQLVRGNYRNVGVIGGSELYMIARAADDDTGKLFAMRYAEPTPCEIPRVVRWAATREPSRSAPLFSYFEEDVRRGTLRFADAKCESYSLSFEDARLPLAETVDSVVVWAGSDLWLATPETGHKEQLATDVVEVTRGVFGGRFAVREGGALSLFDAEWKREETVGTEVSSLLSVGQSLFFVDASGVHRVVASKSRADLEVDDVVSDGCSLGTQDGVWVTLRSPCVGGEVIAIHEPTGQRYTLPFDAEPTQLRLIPAVSSPGRDPLTDPFWFFFLRSGADESSSNTLYVRTPSGQEHALGAHGTLQQLRLLDSTSEPYGYALVDVEGESGRYLWWNAAGETKVLAESAMWRADRLIVDFDGTVGSVAVASGDRLQILAEGVPWQAFEYQDATRKWTVLFHDMQEGMGRLSVIPDGLDQLQAVPPHRPFSSPDLAPIASNVVVLGTASLNEVLSGVSYLKDFDLTTLTGRLEYRNLDLRFTADINDGVSDYVVARDELLYSIPYGDDAGIWLVPAK